MAFILFKNFGMLLHNYDNMDLCINVCMQLFTLPAFIKITYIAPVQDNPHSEAMYDNVLRYNSTSSSATVPDASHFGRNIGQVKSISV